MSTTTTTTTQLIQNEINYREFYSWVEHIYHSRTPGLVIGNPGLGKTQVPRQFAVKQGIGLMEFLAFLYEPVDFRGLLVPDPESRSTISYELGKWPTVERVKAGIVPKSGILLADDMLNAPRDIMNSLAEPLCDHTVNGVPLSPDWVIIGTGNALGGGTSAQSMPAHVANRLSIVRLKPDWQTWAGWAAGRVRPELISYFDTQMGGDLFEFDPRVIQPNTPYLTPRSLEKLSDQINTWEKANPGEKAPMWLYASVVGPRGAQLYATLDFVHEFVPFRKLATNPTGERLPSSGGAVFAQMSIIIGGLKSLSKGDATVPGQHLKVIDNVATYMARFQPEVHVAMQQRAAKAVDYWPNTEAWTKFVTQNAGNL